MSKVTKVTVKTFLDAEKYKELIEKYNNILHTEKQVVFFFENSQLRFIRTKRYCGLSFKEKIVKIDNEYLENMDYILNSIGLIPSVKWYRTRSKANLEYEISINLDYVVGYGYLLEVNKIIQDKSKIDTTKIELGNFIESLDIELMDQSIINKKYDEYTLNWERLTNKVSEEIFLK